MVQLLAQIIGDKHPETATIETVTRRDLQLSTVKYKTMQSLPKYLLPKALTADYPRNFDNH